MTRLPALIIASITFMASETMLVGLAAITGLALLPRLPELRRERV